MTYIFTILLLDLLVVILICKVYISRKKNIYTHTTGSAHARLLYIRTLIRIVYTYSHCPDQMLKHLKTEMSIQKLLSYGILEEHDLSEIDTKSPMRQTDKLLFILQKEGFTTQELCVIFNLNNLNSVYVKCHRIRKKLSLDNPDQANSA